MDGRIKTSVAEGRRVLRKAYSAEQIQRCHIVLLIPL